MDASVQALLNLTPKELDKLPAELREKIEAARTQVFAARRLQTIQTARDNLIDFIQMSMPDPEFPEDVTRSRYEVKPIHRLLTETMEKVERGEILRLAISVQPRVGKSQVCTKSFPAWLMGRDPYRQIIVTGYGDEFVKEFGREVRETMLSPFYQHVFPKAKLRRNAKAANRLQTEAGGILHFGGLGGQLTGKGADYLLVDDPIKNAEQARSRAEKDKLWQGFTKDAMSRLMGKAGAVVVTATRWAEDDIIGRLTDPKLGYTTEKEAAKWTVINIPAFADEDDPLGREPGEILWEERTPRTFLESFRELDPAGFAALYMGRPAPPEGNLFMRDNVVDNAYMPQDLPRNLRFYGASDHAVSEEQRRDPSCMGIVGVDEKGDIWVMPELVWRKMGPEAAVDSMFELIRDKKPLFWWAEKGHISKSIGPFLKKRMQEEKVYCAIVEKTPVHDKVARSQSIQGRMSMGKVHLPRFAPWFSDAVEELLTFPNGHHDDFVDFLSWIGIGLASQVPATSYIEKEKPEPPSGSLEWILKSSERIRKKDTATEKHARYLH